MYLQSVDGTDTTRLGVDTHWGGAIVSLTYRGRELVNTWDAGREIQLSVYDGDQEYDGCGGCRGIGGWNPNQAGDRYRHGSRVVTESLAVDHLYTKATAIDWYPDNKGGGPEKPVPTDVVIEQWVSVSRANARAFIVHYRITYTGTKAHGNAAQELPAVYVNDKYNRFVYYSGPHPWSGAEVVDTELPTNGPLPLIYMPEKWAGLVDSGGVGLTVYVPEQYPYGGGRQIIGRGKPPGWSSVYYRPLVYSAFTPGQVITGDYVLVPGDYRVARRILGEIRSTLSTVDDVAPFGRLDSPKDSAIVSGDIAVTGWGLDNDSVEHVEVYVDTMKVGEALYGVPRPDLRSPYAGAPIGAGYRYTVSTRGYPNGLHTIGVRIVDAAGNVAVLRPVTVMVRN